MSDIPDLPPVLERLLETGHHGQIGAYALDSLPAEERVAFEAHLRSCHQCQDELPVLLDAARLLRQAIVPDQRPTEAPPADAARDSEPAVIAGPAFEEAQRTIPEEPVEAESEPEVVEPVTSDDDLESVDLERAEDDIPTPEVAEQTGRDLLEPASGDTTEAADLQRAGLEKDTTAEVPSSTTLEPFSSELLVGVPAATGEDAALLAEAADVAKTGRSRRVRGRIAPGAAPTSGQLAATASARPSNLPWIVAGLGLLFGIAAIIAALALAETKGNLEEEIAFQNSQIDELNAQRDAYLQQTTAITWDLAPTTLGAPDSGGTVYLDPAGTNAVLSVYGMTALPDDQVYQVWYVLPDVTSVAGPALTLDSTGAAVVQLEPDLTPYMGLAVTIEPSTGSELPSTNPVLQTFFETS